MTAVAFSGLAAGSLVVSKRPLTSTILRSGSGVAHESRVVSALGGAAAARRSLSSTPASFAAKLDSVTESSTTAEPPTPEQIKALLNGPINYDILKKVTTDYMEKNRAELSRKVNEDIKTDMVDLLKGMLKDPEMFPGLARKGDVDVEKFFKDRSGGMAPGEFAGKIAQVMKGEGKLVIEYDGGDGKNSEPTVTFRAGSKSETPTEDDVVDELTNSEDGYKGINKRPLLSELYQLIQSLPLPPSSSEGASASGPDWGLALPLTRSVAKEITPQAYTRGDLIGSTEADRWKEVRYQLQDFRGIGTMVRKEHAEGIWETTGSVKLWKKGQGDNYIFDEATVTFKDGAVYSLTHKNVTYRISKDQPGVLLEVLADDSLKLVKDPSAKQLGLNDPTTPHMFDQVMFEARATNEEIYAIPAKRVEPSLVAEMINRGDRLDFWLNYALDVRRDIDEYKQERSWNVRVANFGLYAEPSWYSTDITVVYKTYPAEFRVTDDCVIPVDYDDGKFQIRSDRDEADAEE
ncbi:hypothetical protein IAU59_004402 [Kwoniella sp. CBS 9459]